MKAIRILRRNIRDSFKSVFRNFSLSLASISCITITLIVVSIAFILSVNVDRFTTLVEKDVTIVTFMKVDITQEEIDDVYDSLLALKNSGEVSSIEYQSKSEITKEMMESSDVYQNIMSKWDDSNNPIQPTYLVKVNDIETIGSTAKKIKKIENVETVKYGEGMVEQLISVFDIVRKGSIAIVVALIVVTAFLITNTIKITIFSRKREIEIMRLVGASNINIKIPFIFEGLFLGILGSIIPIAATIIAYTTIYNNVGGQLFTPFIKLVDPVPFVYLVSVVLLLIGILVGMFGSVSAVKKHLKI